MESCPLLHAQYSNCLNYGGNYCSVHNNHVQIATIWIFGYLCTNDDMESKVCEFFVQKLTRDKYLKYEHEDNLCCGRHQDHRNRSLVKPSLASSCIDKNGHLRHLQWCKNNGKMLTFWIFGYLCTNDDMESKDTSSKSKVLCTVWTFSTDFSFQRILHISQKSEVVVVVYSEGSSIICN